MPIEVPSHRDVLRYASLKESEAITFSVTDNGIGIPEEDRSKIFYVILAPKNKVLVLDLLHWQNGLLIMPKVAFGLIHK